MATIIQLIHNGVLGLKFIPSNDVAEMVSVNDATMDDCRNPPDVEHLKSLSRAFLLRLADASRFPFVRSSNKTALAVIVSEEHHQLLCRPARNVVSIFPRVVRRAPAVRGDDFQRMKDNLTVSQTFPTSRHRVH